jgi:RNA polymerase sigma factor (sigma-70 family)
MNANPARLLHCLRETLPVLATDPPTDEVLLDRFVAIGDPDAFAHLVSRHGPMVLGVCRRILRDAHQAEDVAQATFLVLARQGRTIRRSESLAGWLHRTARRLALNHARGEARRRHREAREPKPATDPHPDPLDELSVRDLLAMLDEELDRLPDHYRLPLVLCCLEGCTQKEAAIRLGWPLGSLRGRLERGRALLRRRLVRRGLTLPAVFVGLELAGGSSSAGVPAGFVPGTMRAAVLFATSGGGTAAGLDRGVAELAEAGLRCLNRTWTRVLVCLALVVGAAGAGVTALALSGAAGPPPLPEVPPAAVAAPAAEKAPRPDQHGDPLPDGALLRLGTLRWRAAGVVGTLAFSPDGKTVAAGSREAVTLLGPDGRVIKEIRSRDIAEFASFYPSAIAFSPDGKQLAYRCDLPGPRPDGKPVVLILDLATTRKVQEYPANGLAWLGWSDDGQPLAVYLVKGAVVLRELAAGKEHRFEVENLPDFRDGTGWCVYAPRAKRLAVRDQRGIIHLWDTSTGEKRCALETKAASLYGLAISPDGRALAALVETAGKRTAQVWDLPAGKLIHTLAGDQQSLGGLVFSPDGRTLATVAWDEVRFHDPVTGRERGRIRGLSSCHRNVAFAPDGKTLATVAISSGAIQLWNVPSGTLRPAPEGHANSPNRIAFSPDGTRLATAGSLDGRVFVWDAKTGDLVTRLHGRGWVRSCAFAAGGRSVFVYRTGETLEVAHAGTGRTLHTLKVDDLDQPGIEHSGLDMHLSDDRKTLVTLSSALPDNRAGSDHLLITAWDAETQKQVFRRRRPLVPLWPVVSPDMRVLAFAHGDERRKGDRASGVGPVHLEDLRTGERLLDLAKVQGQTWPAAFSADSRLLATYTLWYEGGVGTDGGPARQATTVRLWELASGQQVLALPSAQDARVAFSADHRLLALAGPDRDLLLWDLRRGREVRRFRGFQSGVSRLAFSPDGTRLVSGLEDSTLLVWDATLPKAAHAGLPDGATLDRAWADLAGEAPKAFAARGALAGWPAETVAFLRGRLKPIPAADPALLRRLIAELDSETFAVREQARARLEEMGEQASGALVEALARKPSLEARRRMEALLPRQRGVLRDTETLRVVRAIAVLEDIGTPEARAVLKTLAGGTEGARQTQEARKALDRVNRRRE